MEYEDLRKVQRIERNTSKVAVLDDDFYGDLKDLLRRYRDAESEEDRRMFYNILKVAKDVMERREQKVLMKALRCVRAKEMDTDGLVSHEQRMFEELVDALRGNRNEFKNMILGESYVKKEKEKQNIKRIPAVEETTIIEPKATPTAPVKEPAPKIELKKDEETGIIELPATKADRPERPEESEKSREAAEDLNTLVVRIIKKVPKFVSADMQEFGPFEANDIVKLPKKEAELLSNRSFVELI